MDNIKNYMKNKKIIILFFAAMFIILIYTSLNTFVANDDLPYSFYYRGEERVTTIKQVINNQESDYLMINGRFFVHCIVQFLLIFGKNLWAILNPIIILLTIGFIYLIVKNIINIKEKNSIFVLMSITALYLLMINIKYVNYWVAGSVNYIWVTLLVIISIYYYIKTNFDKFTILNIIVFLLLAVAHEMSLVFAIMFLITMILIDYYNTKKISYKKLIYFIPVIIGGIFLLKAPGNVLRMETELWWYEKSIIDRLLISIPDLSFGIFNIKNYLNIIPTIYILSILYTYRKTKVICIGVAILLLLGAITNSGWLYFVICSFIFILDIKQLYIEKQFKLLCVVVATYVMVYSMILTPLFNSIRTNYALYLYFIMRISIITFKIIEDKKIAERIIKIIIIVLTTLTVAFEIYAYTYIGNVYRNRIKAIEYAKNNNEDIVYLEKIIKPFDIIHPDSNEPQNKDYWGYRYFIKYFGLSDTIKIIIK